MQGFLEWDSPTVDMCDEGASDSGLHAILHPLLDCSIEHVERSTTLYSQEEICTKSVTKESPTQRGDEGSETDDTVTSSNDESIVFVSWVAFFSGVLK